MDGGTCELTGWRVFAPGTHKDSGEYFSPAACQRIAANFGRYGVRPGLKIGHDRAQRYAKSLGFPSFGTIDGFHAEPNGVLVIDRATGIPRIIGSAINSGFLRGGSIELAPPNVVRDPDDPGREIDGDVLMGVALLGEELPAVPGFELPRATFADGSEVPPLTDEEQRWWLEKMAAVAGLPDAERDDDEAEYPRFIAFAAITLDEQEPEPVDAASIIAALQADPALMEQVLAGMQGAANPAAPAPAEPPMDTPPADDAPAYFKAFAADCMKRMGALEAKADADSKKSEEAQMSAFSAMVDADLKSADAARKIKPLALPLVRKTGLDILTAKTFAAESDRQAAYGEWKTQLQSLPIDPMLRDANQDAPKTGDPKSLVVSNPQLAGMLKSKLLARERPETTKKLQTVFGIN